MAREPEPGGSLGRSIATVGGLTLASRVLGFLRDLLTAFVLGAGPVADAFFVAFRLPNFFRALFAEGAFSASFVPQFARHLEERGFAEARAFAERTLAILLCALLAFLVAAEVFMPAFVTVMAPGFATDPAKLALAVAFARLTFPYLLFMGLVALMGGVLNALYRYWAAAAAPIVLNLVMLVALLGFAKGGEAPGHALSVAVAVAGIGQFLLLVVASAKADMRLRLVRPRWTPDVARLLKLMGPGAIGAGVTQINVLVGTMIASILPTGAISYLYYADRIYQLPLGVIGIAVGTALLPQLARDLRGGRAEAAMAKQNRAVEIALLFALPSAAALAVVPGPIIGALFQRGAFSAADAAATAQALAAFALGLPAYVLVRVLTPGFFAREDTRTPVAIAAVAVAANVALSLVLAPLLAHVAMALATAVAAWINVGLLAVFLRRRGHLAIDGRLRARAPRLLLSATGMAGALALGAWALAPMLAAPGQAERVLALALLVAGGAAVYFGLVLATGAARLGDVKALLRR